MGQNMDVNYSKYWKINRTAYYSLVVSTKIVNIIDVYNKLKEIRSILVTNKHKTWQKLQYQFK